MQIKDRIKELRRVRACDLIPNAKNWRVHSNQQKEALTALLTEVGFAGAEIARELPDGTLELIDGHARAEIAGDAEVPVLILDVTDEEADKILATYDPIGELADRSEEKLTLLLDEVATDSESLAEMLREMLPEVIVPSENEENVKAETVFEQSVQLKPKREYIVVICDDASEKDWLNEILGLQMVRRGGYKADSPFDAKSLERVVTVQRLKSAINAYCSAE